MYKIEKTSYGIKLTFSGILQKDEIRDWIAASYTIISTIPSKFGVFVDMRELQPLSPDCLAEIQKGQKLYKIKGMGRSVVILKDPIIVAQFKQIAKETGIYQWERYINASIKINWKELGENWLINAIDTDI